MNNPLNFSITSLGASPIASMAIILVAMLNLSGCGLKGDLYLSDETTDASQTTENPEAVQPETEAEDDEVVDDNDDDAKKPKAGKDATAPPATMETPLDTPESK